MFEILTSWKRIFIYLLLVVLIAVVGNLGGWIMGIVFGLVFSLLIELFSFIRNDTIAQIDNKLALFSRVVSEHIESLEEFQQLARKLKGYNISLNSSALSKVVDLYGTGLTGKVTPMLLLNSSVEPNVLVQEAGVTILLLNATQATTLFVRSFNFVTRSYWGISYTRPATWEFAPIDESLLRQKKLVERGVDVKRVFICGPQDSKDKVVQLCESHHRVYGLDSRYIELDTIKTKPPLIEVWEKLWPYYLGKSEVGKFVLLSPDMGIIDNEILISYLLDSSRNHVGAAVFFKPDFLDQVLEYYQHLFEESKLP